MYETALTFATKKHEKQTRADGSPYVVHPKRVSDKLKSVGITDDNILSASLLHDTLEDTETTYSELVETFNETVANIVKDVTSDEQQIQKLAEEQFAKFQANVESYETKELAEALKSKLPTLDEKKFAKVLGKALYLTNKLNHLPKSSKLVKLADRWDNVEDMSNASPVFLTYYSLETKYILDHIEQSSLDKEHKMLVERIANVISSYLKQ